MKTFLGVFLGFYVAQWAETKKSDFSEKTALRAINSELNDDLSDLRLNMFGHKESISSTKAFYKMLKSKSASSADSLNFHTMSLLRQYVTIQHSAAYESMKSRGLEIVKDDSLRNRIVKLYDFHYEVIQKLEEQYGPHQFFQLYQKDLDKLLIPYLAINDNFHLSLSRPLSEMQDSEKKQLALWMQRLFNDRHFLLGEYKKVEAEMVKLQEYIGRYLQ